MFTPIIAHSLSMRIALCLTAFCVVSLQAIAQNSAENSATSMQSEKIERERIQRERATAMQNLEQQRKACYQKLAVTPCLDDARDVHTEKERDLKRQEVALNDAKRRRAAAARLKAIDDRNSPQSQQALAERRGRALAESAKREQAQADKQSSRQIETSDAAAKPTIAQNGAFKPSQPSTQPASLSMPKLAPEQRSGQAAKMEKSRKEAAQRERAAQLRGTQALEREAKRKKPATALPIPN
jgi:colicin import membrane protein